MIKKIGTALVAGILAFVISAPVEASAATSSSNKKQIQKLNSQLNKLKNQGATFSKVKSLVTKLVKLDPKKAATYYKTGIRKLAASNAARNAESLAKSVNKLVNSSKLITSSQKKKIVKNVDKAEDNYRPPYQASISPISGELAFA